jgi:radical SAM superfamily enzyme YgiQ (UPF0313 family)
VFRFSVLPSLQVAASMPPDVETRILDEDIEPVDFGAAADLVGVSCMTFNAPRAYQIADRFREERRLPVVLGGFHPTFLPKEAIRHADAVCMGEAEGSVPRLIGDFAAGRLQPFYRSEPVDLAGLPVPDRRLLRKHAYVTPDVLQATRGCPYRCSFCSIAAFHRFHMRTRPVEEVTAELQGLGRNVIFMDDNIIGDRDYALELFAAMTPLGKRWFSQCGIGIAEDAELLGAAVRSGARGFFVGLESLSQDSLDGWGKRSNRARAYRHLVGRLHAAGLGVYAGFMFGGDSDTPAIFRDTLEFLVDADVDALQATRLTPFPGTALFDEMDRAGRIVDRYWGHYNFAHVVFEPLHMSPETLDRGTAWVLREFYARRRVARRWLRQLRYLNAVAFTRVSLPLNLGYRHRLSRDGTFARGKAGVPRSTALPNPRTLPTP